MITGILEWRLRMDFSTSRPPIPGIFKSRMMRFILSPRSSMIFRAS